MRAFCVLKAICSKRLLHVRDMIVIFSGAFYLKKKKDKRNLYNNSFLRDDDGNSDGRRNVFGENILGEFIQEHYGETRGRGR